MNKLVLTILCLSFLFLFSASLSSSPQQTPDVLFEKALYMEEGQGDLQKAIELYKKILKQFPEHREYAAMAQLHIAFCYEKLGTKDKQKAYQTVLDNFPDQTETTKIAQERLVRLSKAQEKAKPKVNQYNFQYAEPVWTGPDVNLLAAPSPDSQALSYIDPNGCVVIRDLSAGDTHNLTKDGFPSPSSEFPLVTRWSPDGQQIVYNSYSEENIFELKTIALEDSTPRLIIRTERSQYIRPYDWSLDGKFILVTFTTADRKNQIVLFSLFDGSMRVIKNLDTHFPKNMSFSPDRQFIVYDYSAEDSAPERDLFLLPVDGSNETHLLKRPADDKYPFWVSDGKRILFLSDHSEPLGVWCLHVKAGQVERAPYPLRVNFGEIIPLGFTRFGSFFFGFATEKNESTFSGEITRIENYFPVIPAINHIEPKLSDVIQIEVPGSEYGTGIAVHENNIFISGWKEGDKRQGIVAKYSTSSNRSLLLEWSLFWPNQWKPSIKHWNRLNDISVSEEGVYVAGHGTTYAKDDVGSFEHKSYLVKFPNQKKIETKTDDMIWMQNPNFFSYFGIESFETVLASSEKNQTYIYTAGSGQANWANGTAVLSKYDSSGHQLWWKTLGDTGPQKLSTCKDIIKHQNNLYIAGYTQENLSDNNTRKSALWKFDPEGNLLWKTEEKNPATTSWGITSIGDFIFVTGGGELANYGINIQKYDTDGNLLWETIVVGPSQDIGYDIATDGNLLYITGLTDSLGPGQSDIFLLEIDPKDGRVLSFNVWGGPEDDIARGIAVNGRDIYIIGETTNTKTGDTDLVLLWFKK